MIRYFFVVFFLHILRPRKEEGCLCPLEKYDEVTDLFRFEFVLLKILFNHDGSNKFGFVLILFTGGEYLIFFYQEIPLVFTIRLYSYLMFLHST